MNIVDERILHLTELLKAFRKQPTEQNRNAFSTQYEKFIISHGFDPRLKNFGAEFRAIKRDSSKRNLGRSSKKFAGRIKRQGRGH